MIRIEFIGEKFNHLWETWGSVHWTEYAHTSEDAKAAAERFSDKRWWRNGTVIVTAVNA